MLTEADFFRAAKKLGCKLSRIKAVYWVETAGNGYLSDGRVKILFEGHRFWKALVKAGKNPSQFLKDYEGFGNVLYPEWDKTQYKGGASEWERVSKAIEVCKLLEVDPVLALDSASYGSFQIMGENAKMCGYGNSHEMLAAFNAKGEADQLDAFCNFITAKGLVSALIAGDWKTFAKGYNGTQYRKNMYDTKLAAFDLKYSKAA